MFDKWRGFQSEDLSDDCRQRLVNMAREARGHILKMTTVAGSGHPGGSMSSIDMYMVLYNHANLDPKNPRRDDRDRIIVSHGHTSPGVYAALASAGYFDIEPALHGFRVAGSPFEGHIEQSVPGVEWDTGNLGQGLSVGVGKAIYARLSKQAFHSYVLMGDGEQQKGQIAEARRIAIKFGLNDITALIDYNRLQISGSIETVLPQNIKAEWEADGWKVVEIDGHDFDAIYAAVRTARNDFSAPYMILARTTMGKGVSFMENDENFHGAALKKDRIGDALKELGVEDDVDRLLTLRKSGPPAPFSTLSRPYPSVVSGDPVTYAPDARKDNRGAFGDALVGVAQANVGNADFNIAVFDCDLAKSVKTHAFSEKFPDSFFQCGITEHSTATTVGALSIENCVSVWADFGMFGMVETYNQARLNAINHAHVKLFCTHSGIDVGEDGKTHQCIDYFGLLNSAFGWKLITPADPNQADRIVRHVLTQPGNFAVVMGRSVIPIITDESGKPLFGNDYVYQYGRMTTVRQGTDLVIAASGNMLAHAFDAWKSLADQGRRVGLVSISDWSDLHADDLRMLANHGRILVVEDHNIRTGLGTAIINDLMQLGLNATVGKIGVTDYASSGKSSELYKMMGMDSTSIAARANEMLRKEAVAAALSRD